MKIFRAIFRPLKVLNELDEANKTIEGLQNQLSTINNQHNIERTELDYYLNADKNNRLFITPCNINDKIYLLSKNEYPELDKYTIISRYSTEADNDMKLYMLTVDGFIYRDDKVFIMIKELDFSETGFLLEFDINSIFINMNSAVQHILSTYITADDTVTEIVRYISDI